MAEAAELLLLYVALYRAVCLSHGHGHPQAIGENLIPMAAHTQQQLVRLGGMAVIAEPCDASCCQNQDAAALTRLGALTMVPYMTACAACSAANMTLLSASRQCHACECAGLVCRGGSRHFPAEAELEGGCGGHEELALVCQVPRPH